MATCSYTPLKINFVDYPHSLDTQRLSAELYTQKTMGAILEQRLYLKRIEKEKAPPK